MAKKNDPAVAVISAVILGIFAILLAAVKGIMYLFKAATKPAAAPVKLPPAQPELNITVAKAEALLADENHEYHEPYEYMDPLDSAETVRGPIAEHLRITYKAATGRQTIRNIDVMDFITDGIGGSITGYCHLRKERRTFYLPRIQAAINLETGEALPNLGAWLKEEYLKTPAGQADVFIQQHGDALRVVFYVAKADNLFKPKDQEKMRDFIYALGADTQLGLAVFDQIKKNWAQEWIVEHNKRLRRLAELDQHQKGKIIKAMEAIVGGSKQAHTAEVKALANAKKLLNWQES